MMMMMLTMNSVSGITIVVCLELALLPFENAAQICLLLTSNQIKRLEMSTPEILHSVSGTTF